MSTSRRVVVIGVGNSFRRDDGAGLRAIELARPDLPDHVEVVEGNGEPARMLEVWDGADLAIVVDAVRSGADPGTVVRAEAERDELPGRATGRGTHALGVSEAVALGRALGRLPGRVVVYGVEGERFDDGVGLTDMVERGAVTAAGLVCREVRRGVGGTPTQEGESCA